MIYNAEGRDARRETAGKPTIHRSAGPFKPVALPAVAAAVNATKSAPRKPAYRDGVAVLRQDAFVD